MDFTFSNNLLILFLLSAKNSWFPEYPPFPAVHGLHGHIKPLFFSFFLSLLFSLNLYVSMGTTVSICSVCTSLDLIPLLSLSFPWPLASQLLKLTNFSTLRYSQILIFPKANTITQSGGKCSFSGKRLCLFLPPLSLPSIGPAGPPKPRERCVHFSAACHLAQREHTPTQLFWIHSLSWTYITLCLKKRFWNVCFTSGIHPKLSCLSLVSKPSLGSFFSRAEIVLPWKGVLGVQPTTQDTPEYCKVSAILFTPFTNLHSVYLTVPGSTSCLDYCHLFFPSFLFLHTTQFKYLFCSYHPISRADYAQHLGSRPE